LNGKRGKKKGRMPFNSAIGGGGSKAAATVEIKGADFLWRERKKKVCN